MALTLVPFSDAPALMIRDHLLPIVRERGTLQTQHGSVRVTALHTGPWILEHWTPFNALEPGEASSPGYRHALERQRPSTELPYGLDVWHSGLRVLRILWADGGAHDVIDFARGSWEVEALAM